MDPRKRFSSRVSDYVRFRPTYPNEIAAYLRSHCECGESTRAADIGSGTGIFTSLLLTFAGQVYAIEPNGEMRREAERQLSGDPRYVSIAASAEATTLPDRSVDLVTAAQSFHWFDIPEARREFSRILTARGSVVLIWNARLTDTNPFLIEYEQFLRTFGTDYVSVNHANVEREKLGEFFSPNDFETTSFPNEQVLDFDGLRGRVLSSSYMPDAGHPRFEEMLADLERLFDRHEQGGTVRLLYHTNVYTGRL